MPSARLPDNIFSPTEVPVKILFITEDHEITEGFGVAGFSPSHGDSITTSTVKEYDSKTDQITTYSGSVYKLERISWAAFGALINMR